MHTPLKSQDLIEQTRLGNVQKATSLHVKKTAAKVIEQQKNHSFASKDIFKLTQQEGQQDLLKSVEHDVKDAVFLELEPTAHKALYQKKEENITLRLPVSNNQSIELELIKIENVFAPNFAMRTSDGRTLTFDETQGIAYRGMVKGNPNSMASVSVFEDRIQALITDHNGNYVLGKMEDGSENYILYNDQKLNIENNFVCGVTDDLTPPTTPFTKEDAPPIPSGFFPGDCVEIYIECDNAMFNSQGGNVTNVNNFVFALMNEVGTLYANENITISVSEIFVWSTPDPYVNLINMFQILPNFANALTTNGFNGRLGHFLSTRSLGGGLAYLDVLCDNGLNAAVSSGLSTTVTPIPTYSWNVMVVAHELGHNFGSPHTQSCSWGPSNNTQIDDCGNQALTTNNSDDDDDGTIDELDEAEGFFCYDQNNPIIPSNGGTIMSYCHVLATGINLNNGFGQEPGDLIRNRYNTANCLAVCQTDGCTDATACNYNPNFTMDDGSCEYDSCAGCTDPTACNFDPSASLNDGSCDYVSCPGVYCIHPNGNASFEWIQDVLFNTISNSSGNNGGYQDFSNISTNVIIGNSYDITLAPGFSDQAYDEYWTVYIDWNNDYTFDATENVFATTTASQTTVTGTITVPTNATIAATRMRIIMSYNAPSTNPCGPLVNNDGEIEDYTINIIDANGGCTDPIACNYDDAVNVDDGSCEFTSCNDFCTGAIPLSCGDVVLGTTTDATNNDNPTGSCITSVDNATGRWYSVVGTGDSITVKTCNTGTTYDTKLFVYTGDCNTLTCVDGNDDSQTCSVNTLMSEVSFSAANGTTYYIFVTGYNTSSGNYELSIDCPSSECQSSLYKTGNITAGMYEASDNITSDNATIVNNTIVTFHADNYIDLSDEFDVALGAQFTADIQPCNTPPTALPTSKMNIIKKEDGSLLIDASWEAQAANVSFFFQKTDDPSFQHEIELDGTENLTTLIIPKYLLQGEEFLLILKVNDNNLEQLVSF